MKDNFLRATKRKLREHNKSYKDVLWVGNTESCISWAEFAEMSNFEYTVGWGFADKEIAKDLLVVGDGWWLERDSTYGCKWEYKELPKKPAKICSNDFKVAEY